MMFYCLQRRKLSRSFVYKSPLIQLRLLPRRLCARYSHTLIGCVFACLASHQISFIAPKPSLSFCLRQPFKDRIAEIICKLETGRPRGQWDTASSITPTNTHARVVWFVLNAVTEDRCSWKRRRDRSVVDGMRHAVNVKSMGCDARTGRLQDTFES